MTDADSNDEAGGPMIGACTGHRCAALWRRREGTDDDGGPGLQALREVVREKPGAVLTSLACVGACAQGPLVGVADRRAGGTRTGEVTWLVGAAEPERQEGLLQWVTDDWEERAACPPEVLQPWLFRMVRAAR